MIIVNFILFIGNITYRLLNHPELATKCSCLSDISKCSCVILVSAILLGVFDLGKYNNMFLVFDVPT